MSDEPAALAPKEKTHQIAEEALQRLSAELAAGRSGTLKAYLAAMGRFRHYSWGNVLLITEQRPTATRVAGYHVWRELGRTVRRGEKGIMIFAPVLVKEPDRSHAAEPAKPGEIFRLSGFRTAYVFDIKQTEGRPLPEFARTLGDPKEFADKLKTIVAERGIALTYDPTIAPALGVSTGGTIRLLPSLSPAEEFSVLAHELAHEMLHHQPASGGMPKVVRETQAEAVAFVVSRGIGLETGSAAADYIALYNGDARTLTESLGAIQEASSQILKDLLPEERPGTTPARSAGSGRERDAGPTKQPGEHTPDDLSPGRSFTGPDLSDSIAQNR
ncbi:MAG TPA: ArdC family protein [Vicinamibacterales bacterium]|jgi:antirestriction protein ArdC|nr:ArdC family protein [Vicinamibacterales bacterium]